MKIKTNICIAFILIFLTSCKKQVENNKIVNSKKSESINVIDTIKKVVEQRDIFINKEYFEQEELLDIKILNFEKTSIDSIYYCLYKINNSESYIFSLDKFLKNEELAKYKIIDTVHTNSQNININVENSIGYKTLKLILNKKVIKSWEFKTNHNLTKEKSIFNIWEKDNIEIHLDKENLSYLFHEQCAYSFPIKILNENQVELIWGFKTRDCVYDVFFNETFNLPQNKIPQIGKPFSKYSVENNTLKVTYYYDEWIKKYRKKMEEDNKSYPFFTSFSIKTN
ncbi:hypothetical protein [Flavobacterium columnare]|uniref:hypothetical protein n=1 Tax=Flavobacterium columnare TaxID=996 RepID=UPI000D19CB27|nr:hypothetical protein [Flavobacterium columnare]PTD16085.1 hypothetical protein C6N29_00210 [Flavobacterium columnare]